MRLRELGMFREADETMAVIIREDGPMTETRFVNEPARHKIADLLGDLTLLGQSLKAEVNIFKGSHSFHAGLVRRLLEATETFSSP